MYTFLGKFGQKNLKFCKLTEIWYRGTLLYAYHDFNVHFFKILSIHIIWANLVQKFEVLQVGRISYRGTLVYPYYGFNVYFFKIFVIHNN